MNEAVVTVVIPAYNAEKYIGECLESVLRQSFGGWRCIVVNDGSKDGTLGVAEGFVARDARFSCVTIPNSGSPKKPRDTGVSMAETEWVVCVDADDYVDADCLEKMLARAGETGADMVIQGMRRFGWSDEVDNSGLPADTFDFDQVLPGREAVMLTINGWQIPFCGVLLKRESWMRLSTYKKDVSWDEYDSRELLINAKRVVFGRSVYHYRGNDQSITNIVNTKYLKTALVLDREVEKLIRDYFGEESEQFAGMQEQRLTTIVERRVFLFKNGERLSAEDKKEAGRLLREAYGEVDKRRVFLGRRVKRLLMTSGYGVFVAVVRVFCWLKRR